MSGLNLATKDTNEALAHMERSGFNDMLYSTFCSNSLEISEIEKNEADKTFYQMLNKHLSEAARLKI